MRRWMSPLIACLLLFALAGAFLGHSGMAETPTPTETPSATFDEIHLGYVVFSNPDGSSTQLTSTKVILGPGGITPQPPHEHPGAMVLSVESGAICYSVHDVDPGTEIRATIAIPTTEYGTCAVTPDLPCETDVETGTQTCTLVADQTIFLPAWSSISHTGDAYHSYENVDANESAVVYVTGLMPDTQDAGCQGGCH